MKPDTMQRGYRREARLMLLLARLAVHFIPPTRIFAWVDRPPRRLRRFASDEAHWVSWAVEHEGTRMNALCLPRALAAQAMLRRRGIASRLCLGVARHSGELAAHAWVEVGQDKMVGGSEASAFTPLSAYGGAG